MAFKESAVPSNFRDVLDRRFFVVDGQTRFAALKTRGMLTSFWRDGSNILIILGESGFQTLSKNRARRYGSPVVGMQFEQTTGRKAVLAITGRCVSFIGFTLELPFGGTFQILPGGSLLCADVAFAIGNDDKLQNFGYQVFFAASLNEDFDSSGAAEDLESLLIEAIGPHVKRIALKHAAY